MKSCCYSTQTRAHADCRQCSIIVRPTLSTNSLSSSSTKWNARRPSQQRQTTGWAKKVGHRLMATILSNMNRFLKKITGRFLRKFVVKRILKIPLHLAYVATLPCGKLISAKQTINDKLQGSVPTQARCGGNFNIHLTTNLPRNFQVKFF